MRRNTVFEGQKQLIGFIILASFFLNILVLTAPLYMLQLFSRVMSSASLSTLIVLTTGAAIALVFYFLFDSIRQKMASRLGTRLEAEHGPVVLNVLVQSASATDRRGAQPIRDLQELRRFVTSPAFIALIDAPWSIVFVAIIFLINPLLGWVALTGVLILFALGVISEFTGRAHNEKANESAQNTNAIVEEMVRNADVVRAMAKTDPLIERWQRRSFASMISSTLVVDRIALMTSLARMVRMMLQIAILGVGVLLVLDGNLTPGLMIATSILLGRAAAPVEQSIAGWRALLSARLAVKRLNSLLANISDGEELLEMPEPAGRLSVENATVVVPAQQNPLIFDISLELRPGDSLGVIGPSGSGKTTFARALVGLQPLSRGFIRIDDAALTDWPANQIGRYVGFLPQRVELFDGTIAENIATMDESAPPSAIVEAAKRAEVHELILNLPGGYNANVGLRGELLSAGQRQRIGLARAFYGEKRLIVLDEPNANLDPDGEEALARAISKATDLGAVVVIVTHRMSILQRLSHAALLQDGRMSRFGTAREIIQAAAKPMASSQVLNNPKVSPLHRRQQTPEARMAQGGSA
jgi:PrtD family type I secretion system ABC transporter